MPTYEYRCGACGHEFEIEQRITADRLTDCPACKQPKLERLISASTFTLKGGGWYKDGYGSPKTPRTESQVADRLSKAINEDKQKEAEKSSATESSSTTSESTSSSTAAPASTGGTSSSTS
jgi:putative FmdB family regulatory protein